MRYRCSNWLEALHTSQKKLENYSEVKGFEKKKKKGLWLYKFKVAGAIL